MPDNIQARLDELEEQIDRLFENGSYGEAIRIAEQACELTNHHFGANHPDHASSLNTLAELYLATGDYEVAEKLYQEALEIDGHALGTDHPHYASDLSDLAVLYQKMGEYLKADSLFQHALEIDRRVLGTDHPAYIKGSEDLDRLHEELRAYSARRSEEAEKYQRQGDYSAAEDIYLEVMELQRVIQAQERRRNSSDEASLKGSPTDNALAIKLNNLGLMYAKAGNFAEAERHLRQALEVKGQAGVEQQPGYARTLNNLAGVYQETGDLEKAEPLYHQAIEIYRKTLPTVEHPAYAECISNLGSLYLARNEFTKAEPLFQEALKIYRKLVGENHHSYAIPLINLAALYRRQRDYSEAEPLYKQSVSINRKALGKNHPSYATSLANLAGLYCDMGRFAAAEPLYREALEIRRSVLGTEHPLYGENLIDLSALFVATGRASEALKPMEEAAAIDDHMIEQVFRPDADRQLVSYYDTFICRNFHTFLSLVTQHLATSQDAIRAAFDVVLRRKAVGAEALFAQRDAEVVEESVLLKRAELSALLKYVDDEKHDKPTGWAAAQVQEELLARCETRRQELEADLAKQDPKFSLKRQLLAANRRSVAKALPEDAVLVEFVYYDVYDFNAQTAGGESLWQPARYAAFAMSAGDSDNVQLIDLGEADYVNKMITAYRIAITGESESLDHRARGATRKNPQDDAGLEAMSRLRAALFDPLLPALSGCRSLFVAADGDLTRLPFETLPLDDWQHIIDAYQVSYLNTGRDALRFGRTPTLKPSEPVVIADPDFDFNASASTQSLAAAQPTNASPELTRSDQFFYHLPGTRVEGERIAGLLGVDPWLDGNALKSRIRRRRSPYILHLATHGFFLPNQETEPGSDIPNSKVSSEESEWPERLRQHARENGLRRSGLALAGANTWLRGDQPPAEAEDGLLTSEDVSGMDLVSTELAVLSACETGLGPVLTGEGVFGLSRAFIVAGVRTLVMSLWKVPDEQTRELMEEFYHRLLKGERCAEALRAAQLELKSRYPNPFYWGAFICLGDPGTTLARSKMRGMSG